MKYRLLVFLLIVILMVACNQENNKTPNGNDLNDSENATEVNKPVEDETTLMTEANNKLGFNLLKRVDQDRNNNIFLSPTSAFIAMLLAYNGTDNDTKLQFENALQLNDDTTKLNQASQAFIEKLNNYHDDTEISLANSLWINQEFNFTDEYAKNMRDFYEAELSELNISSMEAADQINKWVSEATNKKIDSIVDGPLSEDFAAMLINAIYFNGKWTYPFDPELTVDDLFTTDKEELEVPFMMLNRELDYFATDDFQAVKLPYGKKKELSMQIFLPTEKNNLADFIEQISTDAFNDWQTQFEYKAGTILLPKFQLEYEVILNDLLQELGIVDAFTPEKADFSKMIYEDGDFWIDQVKQKTYIDVDEEGTEAAGVTNVEIRTTSAPLENDTFHMEVNRPFTFMIVENETNTVLFNGVINHPVQEK